MSPTRAFSSTERAPLAVVLGLSPTGLYAARELAAAGAQVLGVDREVQCGQYSRALGGGVWRAAGDADLARRLQALAVESDTRPYLLPSNDHYIEFLLDHYPALAEHCDLSAGYAGAARRFLDKQQFSTLCRDAGMPTPGTWSAADRNNLLDLANTPTYPCILKPTLIHRAKSAMRGRKVIVLESAQALAALARQLPEDCGGWLLQEIVPGAESEIALVAGYAGNEPLEFTARKLRQYPPGFGSAATAISAPLPELAQLTREFVQATGYRGMYGAEYKLDPRDGQYKLIEINPRPTLWFQLSNSAGVYLASHALAQDTQGGEPAYNRQMDDVVWRYWLKDTFSAGYYRWRGDRGVFPAPDLSAARQPWARCWAVYQRDDPAPALLEWTIYLRKALGRLLR
ncbi:hypothetical protein [Mangrovimicrobium sediminis]|uniref:carboxylate--amine ligase n=1 Tax=Mangrovimicrobium sediminis TaxID=2562682 RepID=UPI0014369A8F|nr:hypothetical protein [Haliea sp. SAOS-164]